MSDPSTIQLIQVQLTDATEFYCFRMLLRPRSAPNQHIEIMLHAYALVDLIHECSTALGAWQKQTTIDLLQQKTGLSEEELRQSGLIA
jgi:hypothetical protein